MVDPGLHVTLNFHPDRLVGELAILERLAKDTTPEPWGTLEIVRCSERPI